MSNLSVSIAIAYHSGYGHTARLAEATAEGVRQVENATVTLVNVESIDQPLDEHENGWAVLNAADAIIFGAPTYMGGVSGPFKTFADKTSKIWYGLGWKDKLAGGITNSGSMSGDKLSSLQYMSILAAQHGMMWVSLALHSGFNRSDASIEDLNRTGFYLGVGAQANVDEPADVAPPEADLRTARQYGRRIAEAAQRWRIA